MCGSGMLQVNTSTNQVKSRLESGIRPNKVFVHGNNSRAVRCISCDLHDVPRVL